MGNMLDMSIHEYAEVTDDFRYELFTFSFVPRACSQLSRINSWLQALFRLSQLQLCCSSCAQQNSRFHGRREVMFELCHGLLEKLQRSSRAVTDTSLACLRPGLRT